MPHNLSPAALDARLEALESRLAYQEDWLDTLDRTVIEQQRRLDALEKISALMRERLRERAHEPFHESGQTADDSHTSQADEQPPHY
ncbi:MAG: SlyX family protein [Halomonas sp.]|nr:SlyX family protein [Halomonas sp.]MDN6296557.1 SlyX family protein [Halomonas sp.]MDN6314254.1 SlyX family protein [Halomonas sp.]MDN6335063.1 SlyX family protein [Halomonas sp.]